MTNTELREIIEDAINDEIASYEFYFEASKKVKSNSVRDIFAKLAKEELGHRDYLKDFLESKANTIELIPTVDYGVSETIEKTPSLTVEMNFTDALKVAVKKEEEAMMKYQNLADACVDADQKNIFLGLKNMEEIHKTRLEEIYTSVAFIEAW